MFASRFVKSTTRTFSTSSSYSNVARMTLVGRVGATPIQQQSKSGNPYLKYPIAVNTSKDQTSWFNIVAFDSRLIEFVTKYVEKGSLVYVEADASISKYATDDGSTRSSLTLVQQSINPLTWPKRDINGGEESIDSQDPIV